VEVEVNGNDRTVIASGGAYSIEYGDYDFNSHGYVQYMESDGDRVYRRFHSPYIHAEVGGNTVYGEVAYKFVTVTVQIARGGSVIAEEESFIESHYFSFEMVDEQGAAIALQDGDIVRVDASDAVVSGDGDFSDGDLTIHTLTADVDVAADTVSGSAPDGLVWVEANGYDQDVVASGGSYSADFSGVYDIGPGDEVFVGYYDDEHDLGYINAYGAQIIVWEGTDFIQGYVPGGGLVEISISGGGTARVWADSDGEFEANVTQTGDENTPYLIQPNDTVEVTAGDWSASVTAVPLTAEIDTASDEVDVTGPTDATVDVVVNNRHKLVTLSGGSGAATNPFFNTGGRSIYELDLTSGDTGYVRYMDANGHEVRRTFAAPQINARLSNNEVWGYVNGGVHLVTVILADGSGTERARAYDWTRNGGYFEVYLLDDMGHDVIILPDDTVTVQVGGNTVRTMTVAELTAVANQETGEVAGTAPAGRVNVEGSWAEVAPDGTYRRVSGYTTGDVYYPDTNDNRTYLNFRAAGLYVRQMGYQVYGYVPVDNAVTTIRLVNSGNVIDTLTERSSSNGYVSVAFTKTIEPGHTVEVDIEGQPLITIPVPELTATPDAASDQVTGDGPAESELNVYHRYRSGLVNQLSLPIQQWPGGDEMRTVRTDANGSYSANFAADNVRADVIKGGEYGYVAYTNDDGHIVYRTYRTPLVRVDASNDSVEVFGEAFNDWTGERLAGGGVVSGTFEGATNEDGYLVSSFSEGEVGIALGDVVRLTSGGTVITIPVPAQFSATIDLASNVISGAAPASAKLRVRAYHWQDAVLPYRRGGWASRDMTVQATGGQYSADFSGYLNLVSYDYTYVYYLISDGKEVIVNTGEQDVSPLIAEVNRALEEDGHEVSTFHADTIDYGQEQVTYLTASQGGDIFFGLGWSGGTRFKITIEGPRGSDQQNVYEGRGTSSPILVPMQGVSAGSTWKVTVKALDVPHDGFHYIAFSTAYDRPMYDIYLPLVTRDFGN
jgi:hypothetical protein